MPTKYIFVTGGVVSSVGKGITVASIGRILKNRGISVSIMKLDPYLNVDPGTMSPYQHGEVFVTKDGGETDLDLGHYERFVDMELTRSSNLTAGQVYMSLISKERRGDFLGGTIQTVPHMTNEIKSQIINLAEETQTQVVVVEIGGTVGDIESLPFLEALRQMRNDVGRDNVCFIHLTLLPEVVATGELKTKPTQHSVKELRSIGIQPDVIICRSDSEIAQSAIEKVVLFCDTPLEAVIPLLTVPNVYTVPLILEESGLGDLLCRYLTLGSTRTEVDDWARLVANMSGEYPKVRIALVGKYVALPDAYISVKESLVHACLFHNKDVEILWVHSEDIEKDGAESVLSSASGIVIPGGFGPRGTEGMIIAAQYAREKKLPYLGICLGMQVMAIEYARNVLELNDANSTEFNENTPNDVIHIMPEQRNMETKGGTMRLGTYPCQLSANSKAHKAYNESLTHERHRHRFEVNNSFRETFEEYGLMASGVSPDGRLVEIFEVVDHPFMIGVQFHPEFLSRPNRPHPLFRDFIDIAKDVYREGAQPPLIKEEV